MITIFTPAYNRAHLLPRLYESIEAQSCKDFEWVVVDDGSKDNTREVVEEYMARASFPVRYFYQENGGKHRAINRGVKEAKGELFFIADNDDWLPVTAVEVVVKEFEAVKSDDSFAGVCGLDAYEDGRIVGSGMLCDVLDCTAHEIRYQYNVTGDMKEVFRTSVMRQFPFPDIEGERFCPEALVWNRIAMKYKLRYINIPIYIAEYQPDGLTANIMRVRHFSPLASMATYAELSHAPVPLAVRLKSTINYWRFTPWRYYGKTSCFKMLNCTIVLQPLGALMRLNDKRKL